MHIMICSSSSGKNEKEEMPNKLRKIHTNYQLFEEPFEEPPKRSKLISFYPKNQQSKNFCPVEQS